mmetsp:Transcript_64652/g.173203  ORF Transcript_64652/g.173203 Transcript_64652/m.173203 type:complete len:195 (-) Transcript_64652:656-1240(-)
MVGVELGSGDVRKDGAFSKDQKVGGSRSVMGGLRRLLPCVFLPEGFNNEPVIKKQIPATDLPSKHVAHYTHKIHIDPDDSVLLITKLDTDTENVICAILDEALCFNNEHFQYNIETLYSGYRATFSASSYVKRILQYSDTDNCCILVALHYIKRLRESDDGLVLNSFTLQRLFLVSFVLAAKFIIDTPHKNGRW